jgi:hypothetical protein
MTTIAEVIGWKFNHQSGMRCAEVDGVLRIVEFPGGIPSQADQDTWTAEYEAYLASDAPRIKEAQDGFEAMKLFKAKAISDLAFRLGKSPGALTAEDIRAERDRIVAIYKAL